MGGTWSFKLHQWKLWLMHHQKKKKKTVFLPAFKAKYFSSEQRRWVNKWLWGQEESIAILCNECPKVWLKKGSSKQVTKQSTAKWGIPLKMEHSFLLIALHPWILPEILLRITGSFLLLASAVCFIRHTWSWCWLEVGVARLKPCYREGRGITLSVLALPRF